MLRCLSGLAAVIAVILGCGSCERHKRSDPVVVRVYRDRESDFANQLDRKLSDFTNAHHTISSGKWIFVATVQPYNYTEELGGKVATIKPQMVVLDRPSDAGLIRGMGVDIKATATACGTNRMCPVFIPSWVAGEELEAAKELLNDISIESR